jgi:hypothetical protein
MSGANITASTIPASAISGGITVSLPTTTMSMPTTYQIGYTQVQSITDGKSLTATTSRA